MIKKIGIFFSILLFLGSLGNAVLFGFGLFGGPFMIFGLVFALVTHVSFLSVYYFLVYRNINQYIIFLLLTLLGGALFWVGFIEVSRMLVAAPLLAIPILSSFFTYLLWRFADVLQGKTWVTVSTSFLGVFLSSIVVLFSVFSFEFFGKLHDSYENTSDAYNHKYLKENVTIRDVQDEILYTKNKNPVGIRFSYTVSILNDFDPRMFDDSYPWIYFGQSMKASFGSKGPDDAFELRTSYVRINPSLDDLPSPSIRLFRKGGQMYRAVIHMIPAYLSEDLSDNPRQNDDDLNYVCIKERFAKRTIESAGKGTYSQDIFLDKDFLITTTKEYDPKVFYDGLVKEGVKKCPSHYN